MRIVYAGLFALAAAAAFAQDKRGQQDKSPGVQLRNVDLVTLTEIVQKKTKKQFIFTDNLGLKQFRVHFISDEPLDDPDTIFRVYQHLLQVSGFGLFPAEEGSKTVFKIGKVDTPQWVKTPPKNIGEADLQKLNDTYVTRLFRLKYISPRNIQAELMKIVTNPQAILQNEETGVLMISDFDYNIKRIEDFIKLADVKRPDVELKMIQLKNALATHVSKMLNDLATTLVQASAPAPGAVPRPMLPGGRQGTEPIKIVEDLRTNSIIVLAEPDRLKQLIDIVYTLDSEVGFETSGIYVYTLKHADAKKASQMLASIYTGSTRPGSPTAPTTSTPGSPTPTPPTPPSTPSEAGKPVITFDERTNAIIVVSDRNTFKLIEGLLTRLDKRRPQVLIKATVVEVRTTDDFDFGVALMRLVLAKKGRFTWGFINTNGLVTFQDTNNDGVPEVTPASSTGSMLALVGDKPGEIPALIRALQDKAQIQVHDVPEIVTEDNALGEISLSQQEPVLQTLFVGPNQTPITTFKEFVEAKTLLSITPHISEAQEVQLNVKIQIEKFVGVSANPTVPPAKASRELNIASLKVPSSRTVVVGGIQTQDQSETVTQTPWLGDIPILGELFKHTRKTAVKRTLYIFLTPYILYEQRMGDWFEQTRQRAERIEELKRGKLGLPIEPIRRPAYVSSSRYVLPENEE